MLATMDLIGFIPTTDATRAHTFYEKVLGLHFVSDDDFVVVFNANGNTIRVVKVHQFVPAPYTILGWEVPDIEKEVAELQEKGVQFERYGFFKQDELGIWTSPSGSRVAWFKDPDGNTLSVSEHSS